MIEIKLSVAEDGYTHVATAIFNGKEISAKSEKKSPICLCSRKLIDEGCDPDEYLTITRGQTRVLAGNVTLKTFADVDYRDHDIHGLRKTKYIPFDKAVFS